MSGTQDAAPSPSNAPCLPCARGIVAGLGGELLQHKPLAAQLLAAPPAILALMAVLSVASVVPLLRGAQEGDDVFGPFTPAAEMLNGARGVVRGSGTADRGSRELAGCYLASEHFACLCLEPRAEHRWAGCLSDALCVHPHALRRTCVLGHATCTTHARTSSTCHHVSTPIPPTVPPDTRQGGDCWDGGAAGHRGCQGFCHLLTPRRPQTCRMLTSQPVRQQTGQTTTLGAFGAQGESQAGLSCVEAQLLLQACALAAGHVCTLLLAALLARPVYHPCVSRGVVRSGEPTQTP